MTKIAIIQRPPMLLDRSGRSPGAVNRSARGSDGGSVVIVLPNRSFRLPVGI